MVLDAVGSERAALFGAEDGGLICCMLAARRPDRISALAVYGMDPGGSDETRTEAQREAFWDDILARVDTSWGTPEYARWDIALSNPSRVDDEALIEWLVVVQRLAASPGAAEAFLRLYHQTDVRGLLPAIGTPTLVLHRADDRLDPVGHARVTASLVPGAKLVELPGDDHYWVVSDTDDITDEIEEFLTGARQVASPDRVLATVLFTDIVGSTDRASTMGDRAWRELLASHHQIIRHELQRFGGRERGTAGDGFFATFDGPARAVRCAVGASEAMESLGIEIRAGVHAGEVELAADDVRGIAVHIGARVSALAGPREVLVSSTVKDLVAGSGLAFEDAGEHELKGVPDRWRLYRVVSA